MESLGWDDSQILTNTSNLWNNLHGTNLWSNQENQVTLINPEEIFNQIQDIQKSQTLNPNSDSDKRQETSRIGPVTSWVDASTQDLFSSHLIDKSGYGMANTAFGMNNNNQSRIIINGLPNNGKPIIPATGVLTGSFDQSLECLLSATNSNTDTSVEDDDGISMIFSDCRNLWNFGSNSAAASSGESSENNTSNARNKEMNNFFPEETVCQSSKKSSQKRSIVNDQNQLKVGYNFDSSTTQGGFQLISENQSKPKRIRSENYKKPSSSNINFQQPSNSSVSSSIEEPDPEAIAQMKEMIYRAAAFRPVNLGLELVEKPKRKNVKISTDPQTVAARQRRERISERIRVLQRLVPGGSKMDTASMLDEAANYLKFLRSQVKALENLGHKFEINSPPLTNSSIAFSSLPFNNNPFHSMQQTHFSSLLLQNPNHIHHPQS